MVETVSIMNDDQIGSGSALNQIKYTYNGWGELTKLEQDRDSELDKSGSVNDYEITYGYASISSATGRQARVRDEQTLPDGTLVEFQGDPIDILDQSLAEGAQTGRTDRVIVGSVLVAEYDYLGSGFLIGTTLSEIDVFRTYAGSTSGTYDKLDRFNRVVTDRWTKDLSADVDIHDAAVVYNRVGNVTSVDDKILKNSSGNGVFDYEYEHDGLQRLKDAERGHWNGSSISTKEFEETWTLMQVGRWAECTLDLNGNGTLTDTGDLDETRTYNKANELTERDVDGGSTVYTLTNDALGHLEDDGKDYDYVYDAFGRLREVKDRSSGNIVSEYEYNGLGWRIRAINDSDADGSLADETAEHFAYDEAWRLIAIFDGSAAVDEPREQVVYHRAGLDGKGRSEYLDRVILRERDTTGASPDTLDERVYYLNNWRSDVIGVLSSAGEQLESVRYSAYGVPFLLAAGDVKETFGVIDLQDVGQFTSWINTSTYDVRGDLDLDGDVDSADGALIKSSAGGRGVLTHPDTGSRLGYAGYVGEPDLTGTVWHVRNRVLNSDLGRWNRRDPLAGGIHIPLIHYLSERAAASEYYLYSFATPIIHTDPTGLIPLEYQNPDGDWWWIDITDLSPFVIPGSGGGGGGCSDVGCATLTVSFEWLAREPIFEGNCSAQEMADLWEEYELYILDNCNEEEPRGADTCDGDGCFCRVADSRPDYAGGDCDILDIHYNSAFSHEIRHPSGTCTIALPGGSVCISTLITCSGLCETVRRPIIIGPEFWVPGDEHSDISIIGGGIQ